MAHPYFHAKSSAKRHGGTPEDYLELHNWFDQTKAHMADCRHRLVLHNSFGIFLCEQVFGVMWHIKSTGKDVPTRLLGEQHVQEDFGRIPSLTECMKDAKLEDWMCRGAIALSRLADKESELGYLPQTDSE